MHMIVDVIMHCVTCVYPLVLFIPQKPLATLSKHQKVRQKAHAAYTHNAERMKLKHSKRVKTHKFTVGEYASLRIPRIDRTSTDLQRLPCVVVQVTGKSQEMYRLRSKYGVLRSCFRAGDLEPFTASYGIPVKGWEDEPRITVREAARQQSPWNSFTKNRCNCKPGTCDTRRCMCKRNGIECSTHCHKGVQCNNKIVETTAGKGEIRQEEEDVAMATEEGTCT